MYGLINSSLQSMIREKFGDEQWQAVLKESGVPEDSFLAMRSYDDSITYDLASAASKVLGAPLDTCLELFGEYWVLETASKSYSQLLDAAGDDLIEFIKNLNSLHDRITGTFLNYLPPTFAIDSIESGRHHIHYFSQREGLGAFVVGLLKGLSKRFSTSIEFHRIEDQKVDSGCHIIYEVTVGGDGCQ